MKFTSFATPFTSSSPSNFTVLIHTDKTSLHPSRLSQHPFLLNTTAAFSPTSTYFTTSPFASFLASHQYRHSLTSLHPRRLNNIPSQSSFLSSLSLIIPNPFTSSMTSTTTSSTAKQHQPTSTLTTTVVSLIILPTTSRPLIMLL